MTTTPTSEIALLNCPWCGEKPLTGENHGVFTICCESDNCQVKPSVDGFEGNYSDWKELTVAAWNTRATPPTKPQAGEVSEEDLFDALNNAKPNGNPHSCSSVVRTIKAKGWKVVDAKEGE